MSIGRGSMRGVIVITEPSSRAMLEARLRALLKTDQIVVVESERTPEKPIPKIMHDIMCAQPDRAPPEPDKHYYRRFDRRERKRRWR